MKRRGMFGATTTAQPPARTTGSIEDGALAALARAGVARADAARTTPDLFTAAGLANAAANMDAAIAADEANPASVAERPSGPVIPGQVGYAKSALDIALDAKILQESGGKPVAERDYRNTSNERIRSIYGSRVAKFTDKELNRLKSDPKKFFDHVYRSIGGYAFRGRGTIQLTGKRNYTRASKAIFGDDRLVKNPDLVLEPGINRQVVKWYMGQGLPTMSKRMGIPISDNMSQQDANTLVFSTLAGRPITEESGGYLGALYKDHAERVASITSNKTPQILSPQGDRELLASTSSPGLLATLGEGALNFMFPAAQAADFPPLTDTSKRVELGSIPEPEEKNRSAEYNPALGLQQEPGALGRAMGIGQSPEKLKKPITSDEILYPSKTKEAPAPAPVLGAAAADSGSIEDSALADTVGRTPIDKATVEKIAATPVEKFVELGTQVNLRDSLSVRQAKLEDQMLGVLIDIAASSITIDNPRIPAWLPEVLLKRAALQQGMVKSGFENAIAVRDPMTAATFLRDITGRDIRPTVTDAGYVLLEGDRAVSPKPMKTIGELLQQMKAIGDGAFAASISKRAQARADQIFAAAIASRAKAQDQEAAKELEILKARAKAGKIKTSKNSLTNDIFFHDDITGEITGYITTINDKLVYIRGAPPSATTMAATATMGLK